MSRTFESFDYMTPLAEILVSLHVIDEAARRIQDGSITNVIYDPKTASIMGLAQ